VNAVHFFGSAARSAPSTGGAAIAGAAATAQECQ
jgi:hypothetical protein